MNEPRWLIPVLVAIFAVGGVAAWVILATNTSPQDQAEEESQTEVQVAEVLGNHEQVEVVPQRIEQRDPTLIETSNPPLAGPTLDELYRRACNTDAWKWSQDEKGNWEAVAEGPFWIKCHFITNEDKVISAFSSVLIEPDLSDQEIGERLTGLAIPAADMVRAEYKHVAPWAALQFRIVLDKEQALGAAGNNFSSNDADLGFMMIPTNAGALAIILVDWSKEMSPEDWGPHLKPGLSR